MPAHPARPLRATWVPSHTRRYRQPGGFWRVPPLDRVLSAPTSTVVDGSLRLDAAAVERLAGRVAGGLAARGVRRRQVVTWQLANSAAAVVLLRACWRLGAVAAPVLHTLGRADAEAALAGLDVAEALPPLPGGEAGLEALLERLDGPEVPTGAVAVAGADVAAVLFTSGSSGTPKAVLHTHRALAGKARRMAEAHGLRRGDAVLAPAPLAHVSGLLSGVLVPAAAGLATVLMGRFDPAEALALVAAERITFVAGPPTFFVAMAAAADGSRADTTSLRLVSCGGAPVSPAFVDATAETFGCTVKRTYGSTEAPMVTTTTAGDPPRRGRDTDGRALDGVELAVVGTDSGRELGPGEVGELWVRGPELFAGYADPAKNAEVVAGGGWFRTGDLGSVDDDGWLRVAGRRGDLIIRGGENVHPGEVEAVLAAHPDVEQAVVVGVPDPLMGERVAAAVVSRRPLDAAACARWFADQGVARFKAPERVVRLDRLPTLGSGKPDRAALAALVTAAGQPEDPGASR
ncbi:MAG: class I adenylate-forming enzyme family protein [Acidimicrobiales bacterium]